MPLECEIFFSIVDPTHTTINDRAFEMGQAAAKLLIRQIEDDDKIIGSETISINTELIVRESSMKKLLPKV